MYKCSLTWKDEWIFTARGCSRVQGVRNSRYLKSFAVSSSSGAAGMGRVIANMSCPVDWLRSDFGPKTFSSCPHLNPPCSHRVQGKSRERYSHYSLSFVLERTLPFVSFSDIDDISASQRAQSDYN